MFSFIIIVLLVAVVVGLSFRTKRLTRVHVNTLYCWESRREGSSAALIRGERTSKGRCFTAAANAAACAASSTREVRVMVREKIAMAMANGTEHSTLQARERERERARTNQSINQATR